MTIKTLSRQETIDLGRRFSKVLRSQDVVVLEGNLGAGKTTFVKGVLKGLGIRADARSPSFTIVRHYHHKNITLHHIDVYRLDAKSIDDVGLDDYLYAPKSITLIEWGEKIESTLPKCIKIGFFFLKENSRKIIFSFKGYEIAQRMRIKDVLRNESSGH